MVVSMFEMCDIQEGIDVISLDSWVPALRSGVLLILPNLKTFKLLNVKFKAESYGQVYGEGSGSVEHEFWLQDPHLKCQFMLL